MNNMERADDFALTDSFLTDHGRWRATKSGDAMNREMKAVYDSKSSTRKADAMQFVVPFTTVLCKTWFVIGLVIFGAFLIADLSFVVKNLASDYGVMRFKSFRLVVPVQDSHRFPFNASGIRLNALLWNGCSINSSSAGNTLGHIPKIFDVSVPVNGFVVETEAADADADLHLDFELQGSNNGDDWQTVGTSHVRKTLRGVRLLRNPVPWKAINQLLTYDYRSPWPLFLEALDGLVLGICALCVSICGIAARFRDAKKLCLAFLIISGMLQFSAMVGYVTILSNREVWLCLSSSTLRIGLAFILRFQESLVLNFLFIVAAAAVFIRIIHDCIIFTDCSNLQSDPPIGGILLSFAGMIMILSRERFLSCAVRLVEKDKLCYDAEWLRISSDCLLVTDLHEISILAKQIANDCADLEARHYNREASNSSSTLLKQTIPGTRDRSSPVLSLDQLYSQALGLVPIVKSKCIQWASSSNGVVFDQPINPSDYPWSRTFLGEKHASSGQLKSPQRAIEKALIIYHGDVSRVIDICRQRVVFERVKDILACLQDILKESSIFRFVRVKNSLSFDHESRLTGGFRGIVINFCVDTEETRHLGIENHVCEVQLVLRGLAPIQDSMEDRARHARYRQFRAVRKHYRSYHYSWVMSLLARTQFSRNSGKVVGSVQSKEFVRIQAAEFENGVGVKALRSRVCSSANSNSDQSAYDNTEEHPSVRVSQSEATPSFGFQSDLTPGVDSISRGQLNECHVCNVVGDDNNTLLESKPDSEDALDNTAEGFESRHYKDVQKALSSMYLKSTLQEGGILDRKKARVYDALHFSSASSVWFTRCLSFQPASCLCDDICFVCSKPLAAAGTKRRFQLVLLAYAVYEFYLFINAAITLRSQSTWAFRCGQSCSVRLSVLELRNPELPIHIKITEFGLLLNNCKITQHTSPVEMVNNSTVEINFHSAADANGYYFVTSMDAIDTDPVRWILQASNDAWMSWFTIGASGWQFSRNGMETRPETHYPTSVQRNAPINISYGPTWQDILFTATPLIVSIGFVGMVVMGLLSKSNTMRMIWITTFFTELMLFCAINIAYTLENGVASKWIWCAEPAIQLFGVLFMERQVVLILVVYSAAALASKLTADRISQISWSTSVFDAFATSTPFVLLFAFALMFFRRRALRHSRRLVTSDKKQYDEIWTHITNVTDAQKHLSDLMNEASILETRCMQPCRQFNRKRRMHRKTSLVSVTYADTGVPGSLDLESPVNSVDQLYCQAESLDPILLAKVQAWAQCSGGCFPIFSDDTSPSREFVRYDQALDDPEGVLSRMHWGKIKSVDRAMEKVIRAYKQDISRLVDVCRQSIVFQDVSDMVACLRAVIKDRDVVMVRVKNRLDLGYDSAQSAGYRDLSLNLRIVTGETRCLGVETHVCEVQLLLRPFAELKSDSGHKRYVAFRNLRGE